MNVSVCTNNKYIENDLNLFGDCLHKDDKLISESLNIRYDLLKEIKKM